MTLQSGLALADRAMLWTDSAFIDLNDGKLLGTGTKVFQCTSFPAAVSMTTVGESPYLIPEFIGRHSLIFLGLGSFLDACEAALRHYCAQQPEVSAAKLLVAAWDAETDSVRLFALCSAGGTWKRPFEPVELEHFVSGGTKSAAYLLGQSAGFRPEFMVAIADAQRAEPITPDKGGFAACYGVGGSLVEYEVSRSGVTSRVVRDWGDVVGERIEASTKAGGAESTFS